jgi:hypothetical protein
MDVIDYLRDEIKEYYPESSELRLSSRFDKQPRFNFYFQIKPDCRFLLYLNWDGEGRYFTLKCLEFMNEQLLTELRNEYTEKGFRVFNAGHPKSTLSFVYHDKNKLKGTEFIGTNSFTFDHSSMTGSDVMQCINPHFA